MALLAAKIAPLLFTSLIVPKSTALRAYFPSPSLLVLSYFIDPISK